MRGKVPQVTQCRNVGDKENTSMKLESETEQFINADTPRAVWPAYGHHCERSFWDSLSVAEQKALMEAAHEHAFRAGAALASEGEASEQVFVIQSGWIKLSVGANGREQIVAV